MTLREPEPEDSKDMAERTKPAKKPGMITDCKNLYQSKPDERGRTTWVDEYPKDLTAAAENDETAKYALLIRNRKCFENSRKSLEIDSIIVQSPMLKQSLGQILTDYPGVTTNLDRLTFSAPFKPFVHRWKKLVQHLEDESDPDIESHLKLLHDVLGKELHDDLKALDDYILNGVITWATAWMIFEPGELILGMREGQPAIARLYDGQYGENRCGRFFALRCRMVDWDGEYFGHENMVFKIDEFVGTANITKLSAYPLHYHSRAEQVRSELIERGRAFEALSGYHYKHYQGIGIGAGLWGPIRYNVDSRVVIDTYAWNRFNPNKQVSLDGFDKEAKSADNAQGDIYSGNDSDGYDSEQEEDSYDELDSCANSDYDAGDKKVTARLTEIQLLTCGSKLRGYSFKNKKWLEFSISCVRDINFSAGAFDNLVLPQDHKELILALSQSQVKNKETFDDIIQGKGRGMVMLLSGPPGVGKTLTAESVAEYMRAPLYMMSAGDLGLSSSEVESSLSNVLEMATKWNAILLLDEADVFLEQRSSNDLERNKLVSIFLRLLEYYEGILFLTTNRVDNIDAAFQSRIHISMQYKELTASSRKHVWSNFLAASSKGNDHGFGDHDLEALAEHNMNGREIKNVLKTAQLLASRKGEQLGAMHVESVLAIEQRHVGHKA